MSTNYTYFTIKSRALFLKKKKKEKRKGKKGKKKEKIISLNKIYL